MNIVQVRIEQKRLFSAEVELWVTAEVVNRDDTLELGGILSGPKCPGLETIQMAYPLLPIPFGGERADRCLVGRWVIPEANLWQPQTPFMYEGRIELRRGGQVLESRLVQVRLKGS